MSDCLHCDIHEMLDVHLQHEQADLGEIAARVTEVLADLILLAPPSEQAMLLASVVANLGANPPERHAASISFGPTMSQQRVAAVRRFGCDSLPSGSEGSRLFGRPERVGRISLGGGTIRSIATTRGRSRVSTSQRDCRVWQHRCQGRRPAPCRRNYPRAPADQGSDRPATNRSFLAA
jgi:hypothetical protein